MLQAPVRAASSTDAPSQATWLTHRAVHHGSRRSK
jgi:hypothetical protein